jgi:hypothetical protein
VVLAHLGGVGWNAVLPAHGGDAVKVMLVNRRMPRRRLAFAGLNPRPAGGRGSGLHRASRPALLATSLVSLDALTSTLPPATATLLVTAVACLAAVAALFLRRRLKGLAHEVRGGLAALSRPRILVTRILPWLLAGRVLRLVSLALVVTAAGVPFGPPPRSP